MSLNIYVVRLLIRSGTGAVQNDLVFNREDRALEMTRNLADEMKMANRRVMPIEHDCGLTYVWADEIQMVSFMIVPRGHQGGGLIQ